MKNKEKHLYNLDELSDYKVASDDPDVRNWEVRDRDNRVIGKVDSLLVNKTAKRVGYLDIEVDETIIDAKHDPYAKSDADVREFVNKDGENHVIVPIGMTRLDNDNKIVFAHGIDHRTFAETKRYRKGDELNREYEVIVLDSYTRNTTPADEKTYQEDDFYNRDEFDRDRYNKR